MPLSKKRNRERMKQKRATYVQPKDIVAAIKCLDNAEVPINNRLIWTEEDGVQPIPNCPDGRYRGKEG